MKKTNSNISPAALYIGLDVHKEKTVIALLESHQRKPAPRLRQRQLTPPNTPSNALCAKSGETMGIHPLSEWAKEERSQRDYQITKGNTWRVGTAVLRIRMTGGVGVGVRISRLPDSPQSPQ